MSGTVRKIATICYVLGFVAALYVVVFLSYASPAHAQAWFAQRYWCAWALGFVLVTVAALLWSKEEHDGEEKA